MVNAPEEYVISEVDGHQVRGALLGILREMQARDIADKTYIWELHKWVIEAVDEYVPSADDAPYNSAYRAARVVFIDDPTEVGAPGDGPGVGLRHVHDDYLPPPRSTPCCTQ